MPGINLPKKANEENAFAKNDDIHALLMADPTMPQFSRQQNIGVQINQAQQNLTAAGNNAAQNAEVLVENTNTDWINKRWRPMMGWTYMVTCIFDFVVAPILWSIIQVIGAGRVEMQWQPLTLQGAGLYHLAMGAVLGIAAYGRTKEKIESKA